MSCWSARKVPCKSPVLALSVHLYKTLRTIYTTLMARLAICRVAESAEHRVIDVTSDPKGAPGGKKRPEHRVHVYSLGHYKVTHVVSIVLSAPMDHCMLPPLLGDNFRNSEYK